MKSQRGLCVITDIFTAPDCLGHTLQQACGVIFIVTRDKQSDPDGKDSLDSNFRGNPAFFAFFHGVSERLRSVIVLGFLGFHWGSFFETGVPVSSNYVGEVLFIKWASAFGAGLSCKSTEPKPSAPCGRPSHDARFVAADTASCFIPRLPRPVLRTRRRISAAIMAVVGGV